FIIVNLQALLILAGWIGVILSMIYINSGFSPAGSVPCLQKGLWMAIMKERVLVALSGNYIPYTVPCISYLPLYGGCDLGRICSRKWKLFRMMFWVIMMILNAFGQNGIGRRNEESNKKNFKIRVNCFVIIDVKRIILSCGVNFSISLISLLKLSARVIVQHPVFREYKLFFLPPNHSTFLLRAVTYFVARNLQEPKPIILTWMQSFSRP